jgi:hypothetical protein
MKIIGLFDLLLIAWAVTYNVRYVLLKKRVRGLDEPALWLPKAERQEHARKLLAREEASYIQQMIERQTSYIEKETEK